MRLPGTQLRRARRGGGAFLCQTGLTLAASAETAATLFEYQAETRLIGLHQVQGRHVSAYEIAIEGNKVKRPYSVHHVELPGYLMRILLVEDSKLLRLATGRTLARAGYEMSFAGDGDEALLMAGEALPDLILLDMMLPKMSGLEVLKALKKDTATAAIPVVVLTGLSQTNAERLHRDGAFAFLTKGDLALDQGAEPLLVALRIIVAKLPATSRGQADLRPA